ncbi:MAG: PQQ-binding-like beta-propeller repeat protein, partial [Phycisphaerales bacterium]|nr:PQQ-binding-like beta-propeller repeat protein [Phycisphaerales bacterium]
MANRHPGQSDAILGTQRAFARRTSVAIALWAGVSALAADAPRTSWPAFRGPDGLGAAPTSGRDSKGPLRLRAAWKIPLGSGYSGVVVDDGLAITMCVDGDRDVVAAFDTETGKRVWRFDLEETYKGHDGSHDGPISTPLLRDGRVFALSARGRFVSLNQRDGALIWSRQLADDGVPKPHYGFCTCPFMVDKTLVLQVGDA